MSTAALVPKVWPLLEEAIEVGVQRGWTRAHKHTEKPREDTILKNIRDAVTAEICERFHVVEASDDQS